MSSKHKPPYHKYHNRITSPPTSRSPLQFLPAAACRTTVIDNSRDKSEYVLMPITDMMTRNSVVFNVRGCDSVKILLTNLSDPDDYKSLVKVCHVMPYPEPSPVYPSQSVLSVFSVCLSVCYSVCLPVCFYVCLFLFFVCLYVFLTYCVFGSSLTKDISERK